MAYESLSDFEVFIFLPHLMVYEVYVGLKYLVLFVELIVSCRAKPKDTSERRTVIYSLVMFVCLLVSCCFCCFTKNLMSCLRNAM